MAESIEKKLRVPVVSLASIGRIDALVGEIALLGRILGREERAARLAAFVEERLGPLRRGASGSGEKSRPSIYLSFWGSLVRTPVVYEPVDMAGGRNVAAGLLPDYLGAAGATVSVEQLVVWDPEVILIQGSYPPAERRVTVEGILRDPRLALCPCGPGGTRPLHVRLLVLVGPGPRPRRDGLPPPDPPSRRRTGLEPGRGGRKSVQGILRRRRGLRGPLPHPEVP